MNRGIGVLQTRALPLGHDAITTIVKWPHSICGREFGADYGDRTRHLDLGKVALYQMS